MPWEKKYSDREVTGKAMRAFWAQGYEATSVSDLVAATGLNRGSLYSAFTDKRHLFLAALRHYDRVERQDYLSRLAAAHAPHDAILAAFEAAAADRKDAPAGCLLVNTALEAAPHDAEIRRLVNAAFAGVETFFRDRLRAADPDQDADAAAKALLGLFLGLRVMTRAGADPAARNAVVDQARAMLG